MSSQDVGDSIVELAAAGTDLVRSSITFRSGSNLENLTLLGAAAINGSGNPSVNVLTGNNVVNTLNGGGGADTMIGLNGNDTYIVDNVGDVVTETATGGTADRSKARSAIRSPPMSRTSPSSGPPPTAPATASTTRSSATVRRTSSTAGSVPTSSRRRRRGHAAGRHRQ